MITYTKRAEEVLRVQFNFTTFLASIGGDTISDVEYLADTGITFAHVDVTGAVITVLMADGEVSTGYHFGVTVTTAGGVVETDLRRLRVRGETVANADIEYDGGDADDVYTFELDGGDADDLV
jgi:hypothetical protein